MKEAIRPTFVVGEKITIVGMHKNWTPVIVAIEGEKATVMTEGLPGSERTYKLKDLEKIK